MHGRCFLDCVCRHIHATTDIPRACRRHSLTGSIHQPSPLQLVAPVPSVVVPAGQIWQGGLSTVELPPREKVPVAHGTHPDEASKPVPGEHVPAQTNGQGLIV